MRRLIKPSWQNHVKTINQLYNIQPNLKAYEKNDDDGNDAGSQCYRFCR